jgi:uncharacterized phage protein gp47/JayE
MADTPQPRSMPQTLGEMFDAFLSNQGITSLRAGGPIVSILEAAAQSDLRNSQDIFTLLASVDLDNATGLALARIGLSEGLPKIQVAPSTGLVTITDSSFEKISSSLFQGLAAPIVGSTSINVVDASLFPSSGNLYLGRGTVNNEGPIPYTSTSNVGDHWVITLATGTTKFHNTFETCVLAQGGYRVISPNTVVATPQANISNAINFQTQFKQTLADGENVLPNVQVTAQTPGVVGNVIANSITIFPTPPFDGATVTNPSPFTNGRETESDDDYRDRIRDVRASRQLGTALAIETAVVGITAPDENKRVNSASLVKRFGFASTLYIDDGTGYEEITAPVPLEFVIDSAIGGEYQFETTERPIARAYALTTSIAPFVLRATDQLSVNVGGVLSTHAFNAADFQTIGNATAYELVASINSDPSVLFRARTVASGTQVAIFANTDTNEDIEVVAAVAGTDANDGLGFPLGRNFTIELFKNDRLLTKDGIIASYSSQPFAQWSPMVAPQILTVSIDGTPDTSYTFDDQDFINANTGFATLGTNSLPAWAAVFNAKIPGQTTTISNGRLVMTSNVGPATRAGVKIDDCSLVANRMFVEGSAVGAPSDYTLDRNEGQISLTVPLSANDQLSAGTVNTRAFIQSGAIGTVTLGTDAKLWFVADGNAQLVQTGISPTIPITIAVDSIHDWGHLLSLTSSGPALFANVNDGDWIVLWDTNLPASLQGVFRVANATSTKIFIERHTSVTRRYAHRSVALASVTSSPSKILTAGGAADINTTPDGTPTRVLPTAEIFDPATGVTTPTGIMNNPRCRFAMVQALNGKVIAAGGMGDLTVLGTIEIYDPTLGTWTMSAASLATPVHSLSGTLLASGKILFAGGDTSTGTLHATNATYLYDPSTDSISATGTLVAARANHQTVVLHDGITALTVGGYDNTHTDLATAELTNTGTMVSAATGSMDQARSGFGMATVGVTATTVIAAGNNFEAASGKTTYNIYTVGTGLWAASATIPHNVQFENKDLVHITNGDVVGLHGYDSTNNYLEAGFVYDGSTFTLVPPNSLLTDFGAKWLGSYVEITNGTGSIKNIVAGIDGSFFHSDQFGFQASAMVETYDPTIPEWSVPDPAAVGSVTLLQTGAVVVSTDQEIQDVDVPSASNYTASSLVAAINEDLNGATASIYRTNALRVNTNSYLAGRDLSLVTQNVVAAALQLTPTSAVDNLADHIGAVESGNGDNGTPTFEDMRVISGATGVNNPQAVVSSAIGGADQHLIALRNGYRGSIGSDSFNPTAWSSKRANNNYRFVSTLFSSTPLVFPHITFLTALEPREVPQEPWGPWDSAYLASPLAIGQESSLGVMVDDDIAKQFSIPMWRTLKTVGDTYGATNTFKDKDAGNVSMATTFGLGYDFNDFAVYMAARTVAYTDPSQTMLFRYYRLGPDGNGARVRVGQPLGPNQPLSVVTALDTSKNTNITIRMGSGALRTLTVHNSTQIGYNVTNLMSGQATIAEVLNLLINTAQRTANVTTLTMTLPAGISDHGLVVGNNIWVQSTDVNFSSGLKTITARTATTISYAEVAANEGPDSNIGTVSFDSQGEATWNGSATSVNDCFLLTSTSSPTYNDNTTFRVSFVSDQYLQVTSGDQVSGLTVGSGTLLWQPIALVANLQVFPTSNDTTTTFAAKVNALAAVANSTCPLTVTVLGSGTGPIVENTPDFIGNSAFWYILADGVNWVQTTTSPGSLSGDYQLTFKNPITGSLASGADWTDEIVHIVPITSKSVVEWLNTPTVTGLFTVADIETSNDGANVQIATLTPGSIGGIQVQGGLANSVVVPVVGAPQNLTSSSASTIATSDATGILAGMWARIQNTNTLPKPGVFTPGLVLNSWTSDGRMSFSGNIVSRVVNVTNVKLKFEKQGNFVAIEDLGFGQLSFSQFGEIDPGSWLYITPASSPDIAQVSGGNQGLFQVVRAAQGLTGNQDTAGFVFIENENFIEEISECNVQLFTATQSVMPGDQIAVLSPLWGIGNQGIWDVKTVGTSTATSNDLFANTTTLVVDTSSRVPIPQGSAPALDSTSDKLIYVIEGEPQVAVMRVIGITPNQVDGSFTDIHWDRYNDVVSISANAGSLISILDKLNFDLDFHSGFDGYRYDVGLIGEANKVIYGDPNDTATYPGVASADAHINIQGPLVKRIQVALSIRVKSGLNTEDIQTRIQSAVATVINQTPIGTPIAFSDIIDAASQVVGVVSVTIVSPIYNVANDQIPVQPYEKPYVLNLTQDVQVSFLGL